MKKRQKRNRRLFVTEREGTVPHVSHPQKKHTYISERERDSERDQKKEKKRVVARVVGYKSENVRKFFLFFFARQRGESKLERNSEMVRR